MGHKKFMFVLAVDPAQPSSLQAGAYPNGQGTIIAKVMHAD